MKQLHMGTVVSIEDVELPIDERPSISSISSHNKGLHLDEREPGQHRACDNAFEANQLIPETDREEVLNESSLADAKLLSGSSSGRDSLHFKGRQSLDVEPSNHDELEDSLIQEAIEIISATTPNEFYGSLCDEPDSADLGLGLYKNTPLSSKYKYSSPTRLTKRLSDYISPERQARLKSRKEPQSSHQLKHLSLQQATRVSTRLNDSARACDTRKRFVSGGSTPGSTQMIRQYNEAQPTTTTTGDQQAPSPSPGLSDWKESIGKHAESLVATPNAGRSSNPFQPVASQAIQ